MTKKQTEAAVAALVKIANGDKYSFSLADAIQSLAGEDTIAGAIRSVSRSIDGLADAIRSLTPNG